MRTTVRGVSAVGLEVRSGRLSDQTNQDWIARYRIGARTP